MMPPKPHPGYEMFRKDENSLSAEEEEWLRRCGVEMHPPEPSLHADPELARVCPYCHPRRMLIRTKMPGTLPDTRPPLGTSYVEVTRMSDRFETFIEVAKTGLEAARIIRRNRLALKTPTPGAKIQR